MRTLRAVGTQVENRPDGDLRRRRIIVAITLVVGMTLLGFTLAVQPGDASFYPLTLAVAATWAIGGFLSGPVHLGYEAPGARLRRPVLTPFVIGLVAAGVFVLGALVVREIGPLRDYVVTVLDHARKGNLAIVALVTVVNGVAEEIFFRGALFTAIGRHRPVLVSTLIYTLATVATANPMLVFAALLLGTVWGLQRRATGGVLASTITHVTWSLAMLFALPPLLHH